MLRVNLVLKIVLIANKVVTVFYNSNDWHSNCYEKQRVSILNINKIINLIFQLIKFVYAKFERKKIIIFILIRTNMQIKLLSFARDLLVL